MNNKMTQLAFLATILTTLSACAPMTPAPVANYTPPAVQMPEPVTPPIAMQPELPTAQHQYVVQLTASSSQQKAAGLRNQFAADGYNTFVSPLNLDGKLLHRVQIGYFNNENDARMVLAQMQQHYPGDVYVADAVVKTP